MKFVCEQADLLQALNTVTRAVAARSTAPVLECVHIEAADDRLTLMCTDLSMGIETALIADVREDGALLLPARMLHEIVRKLPAGEVAVEQKDLGVVIRASGSRTSLMGLSAGEFPAMPEIDEAASLLMDQRLLRDMVRQTSFAAAAEENNPVLTGLLLEAEEDSLSVVALDRFRLALRKGKLRQPVAGSLKAIIPARSMNEIARMLSDDEEEISLGVGKTHVLLELGGTRVTVRLLDGDFINYRQLIPAAQKITALIEREAFAACVDRAALIARDTKNHLINLAIDDDKVIVTSQGETSNFYEELPVELQGPGLEIAFNVRYVSDVVGAVADENIAMHFTSPVSPCVVTPMSGDEYLYLLLPVRVFGK